MELVKIPKRTRVQNLIGGEWRKPSSSRTLEVRSPYNQTAIADVGISNAQDVDACVLAANQAFLKWKGTPLKERTQILFKFRDLVLKNLPELSHTAAAEAGKTVAEAEAGLLKGLEVTEFALSLQNLDSGAAMSVSRGVTCEARREPLGVVCGIVPFNFPAMVPMWMFPIAITCGNCFIMKPSEKVPLTLVRLAELMRDAGYPPGVFSLLQGDRETAELLADHPGIAALAFVGSTPAAQNLYARATSHGKRALCLGGAKNPLILVPDANPEIAVDGIVKSFTGCAGQRCMAASLLFAVGQVDPMIDRIVEAASKIKLGFEMGAIIDRNAMQRIKGAIDQAEKDGCRILLDGRKAKAPQGYEDGCWIGPTVIDRAQMTMDCVQTEIFGPVITIVRVENLGQALCHENGMRYGNATSVFTSSGSVARYVGEHARSGMIGINVGVPVPREPFSFGGTRQSKFGHGDITGVSSLDFWTDMKKITTKWQEQSDKNWMNI